MLGKRSRLNSIKLNIIFYFSGIVILILAIFGYLIYYISEENIKEKIKLDFYSKAIFIEKNILDYKTLKKITYYDFAIYKDNKLIYKTKNFKDINFKGNFYFKEIDEYNILAVFKYKVNNLKIIILKDDIYNKAEDIEDSLLLLIPLLGFILIFLNIKIINKILTPINNLTKKLNKISINKMPKKLSNNTFIEFRDLINSYNIMIDRLEDGIKRLERFNSDISHELKTPLTIIKTEIEYTLNKDRSKQEFQKAFLNIKEEIENLENLINNILLLTKYSKKEISKTFKKLYLDSIVLNIISKFEKTINEKNINLELEINPITLNSNETLINTIFYNLIDNGVKYTNNYLKISLYKKENIIFEVISNGNEIDKQEINNLTTLFYRGEKSRNKKIKGFGIGLSIVKNFTELFDGKLQITSNNLNSFKIIFYDF